MKEEDAIGEWMAEHGYLIMTTKVERVPGEIVRLSHKFSNTAKLFDQPFSVLKETTQEEYTVQCEWVKKRCGSKIPIIVLSSGDRFYRVHTD